MSDGMSFSIIILCLGSVFFLIGGGFTIYALVARRKAGQAQAWPAVQGRILSAHVLERKSEDSEGNVSWSYQPVVEYEYVVMGSPYRSSRLAFGATGSGNRAQADQVAARYVPGMACTVYYNPQKPSDAVLERQAMGSKTFLIVGIVFLVVSLLACCGGGVVALFMTQ